MSHSPVKPPLPLFRAWQTAAWSRAEEARRHGNLGTVQDSLLLAGVSVAMLCFWPMKFSERIRRLEEGGFRLVKKTP
jgi:hypothetical protein